MAAIFGLFAAVENGRWSWGLGDPDLGAVLVTGLYFLVAGICLVVGRRRRRKADPLDPLIRPAATFSPRIGGEGNGTQSDPLIQPAATFSPAFGGEGNGAQSNPLIRPAATFSPDSGGEGNGALSVPSSGLRPLSPPKSGEKGQAREKGRGEAGFWLVLAGMLFCLWVRISRRIFSRC